MSISSIEFKSNMNFNSIKVSHVLLKMLYSAMTLFVYNGSGRSYHQLPPYLEETLQKSLCRGLPQQQLQSMLRKCLQAGDILWIVMLFFGLPQKRAPNIILYGRANKCYSNCWKSGAQHASSTLLNKNVQPCQDVVIEST